MFAESGVMWQPYDGPGSVKRAPIASAVIWRVTSVIAALAQNLGRKNMGNGRMFERYIGIDYSGTSHSTDTLDGLAVCCAVGDADPVFVPSWEPKRKRWSREALARWLLKRLQEPKRTLVGVDHAFSFPIDYFKRYFGNYELPEGGWNGFLEDFQGFWPTDGKNRTVAAILHEQEALKRAGKHDCHRLGNKHWFRLTDGFAHVTSSVFDYEKKQGNVSLMTHAGLPWLLDIRGKLEKKDKVHFWPFDGSDVSQCKSVVVEVYPSLWNWRFPRKYQDKGGHKHDAYSVARWMSEKDQKGELWPYFKLLLTSEQSKMAETEGWIFGVLGSGRTEPG